MQGTPQGEPSGATAQREERIQGETAPSSSSSAFLSSHRLKATEVDL